MTIRLVAVGYQGDWWAILTSPFMRDALLGGTIVALAAGLIGYFVVIRNTAFAAHALAEIGLPGATGAVLVGLPVAVGLGVFCVVARSSSARWANGPPSAMSPPAPSWQWPSAWRCSSTPWLPRHPAP